MARCSSSDPELFFSVGARESKLAKQICKDCPVRLECLQYAMELPVTHGTWGGMTERERRRCRRAAGAAGWRSVLLPV
jgi:WhiB family redox-sensing transcriptional regulator